jgi:hypothetical protein
MSLPREHDIRSSTVTRPLNQPSGARCPVVSAVCCRLGGGCGLWNGLLTKFHANLRVATSVGNFMENVVLMLHLGVRSIHRGELRINCDLGCDARRISSGSSEPHGHKVTQWVLSTPVPGWRCGLPQGEYEFSGGVLMDGGAEVCDVYFILPLPGSTEKILRTCGIVMNISRRLTACGFCRPAST